VPDPGVPDSGSDDGGSPEALCAASFAPCGGDVAGSWNVVVSCPPGGGSLTQPCESPYDNVAQCQGAPNSSLCTQAYHGTMVLGADRSSTITMVAELDAEWKYGSECLLAIDPGAGE
jgi:hypothetical protein